MKSNKLVHGLSHEMRDLENSPFLPHKAVSHSLDVFMGCFYLLMMSAIKASSTVKTDPDTLHEVSLRSTHYICEISLLK